MKVNNLGTFRSSDWEYRFNDNWELWESCTKFFNSREFSLDGELFPGDAVVIEGDDLMFPDAIHIGKVDPNAIKPMPVKVKFNGPATIVWWSDGVKTVAKCRECRKCVRSELGKKHKFNSIQEMMDAAGNSIIGGIICGSRYNKFTGVMAAILKRYVDQPAKTITKLMKDAEPKEDCDE